ncbi:MAG: erythromycin esterase family protein [Acidimicrobiales bacterium]|nr:erythromycin esterase family protein [Acidimicrobiales bacterium]
MLSDRAIPLELDGERGSIEPFAILDELADRCRIAFVGEMDHFVAEKSSVRLLVCRYLASRGWTIFGEEWPETEHQRPFRRGVLADAHQPSAALGLDQARFHEALARVVPGARWFSFDADGRDTDYVELAEGATTYEELRPAMARREQIMHEKVARALEDNPGEKVALLAAAQHLLKDDTTVSAAGVGAGPGGGTVPSIGHHVAHELSPDVPVLSVWFLHGSGTSANPWLPPPGRLEPVSGTVDAELLARVRRPCLVPVFDDHQQRTVTAMHNHILRCRFSEQVDAIVFAPEVSPISG